ncbi:MAG TPA: hypothetical protein VF885_12890 [Arthrobacter sp.]
MKVIAHTTITVPSASVSVNEDPASRELTISINGFRPSWHGTVTLGAPAVEPGDEHAWIRTRTCEALYTAMGPHGLDAYTQMLIRTSPGWYEVCELVNAELGAGRVLE